MFSVSVMQPMARETPSPGVRVESCRRLWDERDELLENKRVLGVLNIIIPSCHLVITAAASLPEFESLYCFGSTCGDKPPRTGDVPKVTLLWSR